MNSNTTFDETPTMTSGWKLEQEANSRPAPHTFANHTAYVTGIFPKFSEFTELSRSGDNVRRFLAHADASLALALNGLADDDSDAKPVTVPVMRGALVLVEEFPQTTPYPSTWFYVSVPSDVDAMVEEILAGDDGE